MYDSHLAPTKSNLEPVRETVETPQMLDTAAKTELKRKRSSNMKQKTEYKVQCIHGARHKEGEEQYLVEWAGYKTRTWQPKQNLIDDDGCMNDKLELFLSNRGKPNWK